MLKSGVFQSCPQSRQIQWIANSGATDHTSPTSGCFKFILLSVNSRITTAERGILHVTRIGDVNLDKLGSIKKVLYVPDLKTHVISMQKLVDDSGWLFILYSDDCF